jgi:predicted TIM-barrel fold metal-dependent hydrolase
MITDVCAHLGPFSHRPIGVDAKGLAALLAPFGVSRIYAGRLEALWFENPHDANRIGIGQTAQTDPPMTFVPVLDPTVATWSDELERLARAGPLPMVRLHPNYGGYALSDADPLLDALARRHTVAQIIVRMEDPRRQNRQAQVGDVNVKAVLEAATRHSELTVLLSGAGTPELTTLAKNLPKARNLWADTSQADGLGAVPNMLETDWHDRLVFGSHAPLFIPYSALARVVVDLDDEKAERVLAGNVEKMWRAG